jgi:hypothetical protein
VDVSAQHVRFFLDIRIYLAPNYLYDALLKHINVNEKSFSFLMIGLIIVISKCMFYKKIPHSFLSHSTDLAPSLRSLQRRS